MSERKRCTECLGLDDKPLLYEEEGKTCREMGASERDYDCECFEPKEPTDVQ